MKERIVVWVWNGTSWTMAGGIERKVRTLRCFGERAVDGRREYARFYGHAVRIRNRWLRVTIDMSGQRNVYVNPGDIPGFDN